MTVYTAKTADDDAVIAFAYAMQNKMFLSSRKGRSGWQNCSEENLWQMLKEHINKGDPVDVANFAMMIWHNRKEQA